MQVRKKSDYVQSSKMIKYLIDFFESTLTKQKFRKEQKKLTRKSVQVLEPKL